MVQVFFGQSILPFSPSNFFVKILSPLTRKALHVQSWARALRSLKLTLNLMLVWTIPATNYAWDCTSDLIEKVDVDYIRKSTPEPILKTLKVPSFLIRTYLGREMTLNVLRTGHSRRRHQLNSSVVNCICSIRVGYKKGICNDIYKEIKWLSKGLSLLCLIKTRGTTVPHPYMDDMNLMLCNFLRKKVTFIVVNRLNHL